MGDCARCVRVPGVPVWIALALLNVGCDPLCEVRGLVSTADGREGVECGIVMQFPGAPESAPGHRCWERGNEKRMESTVRAGREFVCSDTPGDNIFEVRVRCEGYHLLVTEPFQLADGHSCFNRDLGVLTVRPSAP